MQWAPNWKSIQLHCAVLVAEISKTDTSAEMSLTWKSTTIIQPTYWQNWQKLLYSASGKRSLLLLGLKSLGKKSLNCSLSKSRKEIVVFCQKKIKRLTHNFWTFFFQLIGNIIFLQLWTEPKWICIARHYCICSDNLGELHLYEHYWSSMECPLWPWMIWPTAQLGRHLTVLPMVPDSTHRKLDTPPKSTRKSSLRHTSTHTHTPTGISAIWCIWGIVFV